MHEEILRLARVLTEFTFEIQWLQVIHTAQPIVSTLVGCALSVIAFVQYRIAKELKDVRLRADRPIVNAYWERHATGLTFLIENVGNHPAKNVHVELMLGEQPLEASELRGRLLVLPSSTEYSYTGCIPPGKRRQFPFASERAIRDAMTLMYTPLEDRQVGEKTPARIRPILVSVEYYDESGMRYTPYDGDEIDSLNVLTGEGIFTSVNDEGPLSRRAQ